MGSNGDTMRTCLFLGFVVLLLAFPVLHTNYNSQDSFEALSIFTYDGLILKSISVSALAYPDHNMTIAVSSQFEAAGISPIISFNLNYGEETIPMFLGKANVIVDVVYHMKNGRRYYVGSYFRQLLIDPQNYTNEIQYVIDLTEEMNSVFSFLSSQDSNLTIEDVGFLGRISIRNTFANSTGAVANKRYVKFPLTCDGNMTIVTLDFTFPEEADLIMATWGSQDMVKIFPNRVQTSFSVLPDQRISSEIYVEWKMPEPLPPIPWYDEFPWKYLMPGFIGLILTLTLRDGIPRIYKFLRERAMKIAFLGWGSLVWDLRDLQITGSWEIDGPFLPVELARISQDGRITLVLYPDASDVRVLWARAAHRDLQRAIDDLRRREGTSTSRIGFVSLPSNRSRCNVIPDILPRIRRWTKEKGFDAVVWTDLPSNFKASTKMDFNEDNVVKYLRSLEGHPLYEAENYIRKVPEQIETKILSRIRREIGWKKIRTDLKMKKW